MTHTGTGWNDTLFPKRRGRARLALTVSLRLPCPAGLAHNQC